MSSEYFAMILKNGRTSTAVKGIAHARVFGNGGKISAKIFGAIFFPLENSRAITRPLISGGRIFVYSWLACQVSLQIDQFEFDLKRNSLRKT